MDGSEPLAGAVTADRAASRRACFIGVCIVLCWLVLVARLIHIQGSQRTLLSERVQRQRTFTEVIPARPGEILDRNGHALAMTVTRDSIYAVPARIDDPWEWSWKVGAALQLNTDDLFRSLTRNASRQFIWVRRRVSEEQLVAMRSLRLPPGTWGTRKEYLRQYPQGHYAAHLLGIRDIDNIGHGGLEESLDSRIRGRDGERIMTRDALGVVVEVADEGSLPPIHGRSVVCSIDLAIQIFAEEQLDQLMAEWQPEGACVLAMEPHTGEILAMASRPTFDPNLLADVPESAWKNLCISYAFEPGSTFKPFVVGRAIQDGYVSRDEQIDCSNGALKIGRRILHDHHPYGQLSVTDVLVKSSNIGMARIAQRMGLPDLYDTVVDFGFGRRTGIELPGEIAGLLRPLSQWDDYSMGSIPMGHEIAVTPLQLITAHSAIANGGRWIRPRVVRQKDREDPVLRSTRSVKAPPPVESRVLSSAESDWLIREPLTQVVARGTGRRARIPGLDIFGKTGTAQKFIAADGRYSDHESVLSFVCGAPRESPRLLVLLVVDAPQNGTNHAGGSVAAPTAARILQYGLQRLQTSDQADEGNPGAEPGNLPRDQHPDQQSQQ